MTNIDNNFRYIILYIDEDNKELDGEIYSKFNNDQVKLIRFLLPFENKSNKIEIYIDDYIEEYLIEDSICIFYFSKIQRSENLINLIQKYKKNIFFEYNFQYIVTNFDKNDEFQMESLNAFNNYYNNLFKISKNKFNKNIKLKIEKNPNKDNMDISSDLDDEENNINIVTYYKHSPIDILNIIQKKCIYENLKNRNIKKMVVIGYNLKMHFSDIIDLMKNDMLLLHETNNNITFKDIFEISNIYFKKDKIVCILRSDIVLPNQVELNNINIDNNTIISLSRIERLINGQLIKYDKLNKNLNSTEQDGWIFKSPLLIDYNLFSALFFYEKYSNLYLNNILKNNNYTLINDTKKYKIIRILFENNMENRPLLDNNINLAESFNSIFLLPDNESLEKISIDDMLKNANISQNELYLIKCDFFNKFYKNKIML